MKLASQLTNNIGTHLTKSNTAVWKIGFQFNTNAELSKPIRELNSHFN